MSHLEGEVDWPVVRPETHRTALLQNGLMGSVKPIPQARDPIVVMATRRVVVQLIVIIFMVPQQVGVKVTAGEPLSHSRQSIGHN